MVSVIKGQHINNGKWDTKIQRRYSPKKNLNLKKRKARVKGKMMVATEE